MAAYKQILVELGNCRERLGGFVGAAGGMDQRVAAVTLCIDDALVVEIHLVRPFARKQTLPETGSPS